MQLHETHALALEEIRGSSREPTPSSREASMEDHEDPTFASGSSDADREDFPPPGISTEAFTRTESTHEASWRDWGPPFIKAVNDLFDLESTRTSWLRATVDLSLSSIKERAQTMFNEQLQAKFDSFKPQYTLGEVALTLVEMQKMRPVPYLATLIEGMKDEYKREKRQERPEEEEGVEGEEDRNDSQTYYRRWAIEWAGWTEVVGSTRGIRLSVESALDTLETLDNEGKIDRDDLFQQKPEGWSYGTVKSEYNSFLDSRVHSEMSETERIKEEVRLAVIYLEQMSTSRVAETQLDTSEQLFTDFPETSDGQDTGAPTEPTVSLDIENTKHFDGV
ncbi:hypothetical protein BCR39DRAFT_590577 [Naematelia encephala]|uniref:Uncharacterized protein n=1 Tax=Naematelia encephala TaxID=71784 RepID=A0A1Y2APH2_9TREE|nr:hypothetical protein BCR39DRAFT_590577 [Naematelia encephala]